MDETQRRVDEIRKESTELENHIIDQFIEGKMTRRDLMRRGYLPYRPPARDRRESLPAAFSPQMQGSHS